MFTVSKQFKAGVKHVEAAGGGKAWQTTTPEAQLGSGAIPGVRAPVFHVWPSGSVMVKVTGASEATLTVAFTIMICMGPPAGGVAPGGTLRGTLM